MQLNIFEDNDALSREAASEIVNTIQQKSNAVICLASGSTPILTYKYVVEIIQRDKIDIADVTFIGLDEWLGIPPDNEGSCHYFFQQHLFQHLRFSASNIYMFRAMAERPISECERMDKVIRHLNGIDLMLVGIGMNGHIGFNEPGVPFNKYSHIVDLDETTVSVGQKYFKEATVLKQGITLGLQHLMETGKVLLLANGEKKALIIKQTIEGEISNKVPASIMRQHPNGIIMLDKEAASLLSH